MNIKKTKFLGYKNHKSKAKILKILKEGKDTVRIQKGDLAQIILDQTVFYPESGGQVADTGKLTKLKNIFLVQEVKKTNGVIVHFGRVSEGSFKKSDILSVQIDCKRRLDIARNHTATHLLQAALRQVLGSCVQQQGSLVAPERLRFDFTYFKDIGKDELSRIEEIVNGYIMDNYCLETQIRQLAEARRQGALAFFGEKYAKSVRVVSVADISKELCGGTHLDSTGQIGLFKIIQETAVAAGVRRIEAVSGRFAYQKIKKEEEILESLSRNLFVPCDKVNEEMQKRLRRLRDLEKELNSFKLKTLDIDKLIRERQDIAGIDFIAYSLKDTDMDFLRKSVGLIQQRLPSNTVIIAGSDNKVEALLVLAVTPDLCAKGIDASKLIKELALEIGGSGGGRKDFAQAGGSQPQRLDAAFLKLKTLIKKRIQ